GGRHYRCCDGIDLVRDKPVIVGCRVRGVRRRRTERTTLANGVLRCASHTLSLKRQGWSTWGVAILCCRAPLLATEKRGRGLGAWGKGPWGPDGPFPQAPQVDVDLRIARCWRRHETVCYQLSSSSS